LLTWTLPLMLGYLLRRCLGMVLHPLADAPPLAAPDALAPLFVAVSMNHRSRDEAKHDHHHTSARETKCVCASRIQPPHITFQAVAVKLH
jgi:hypothetical protein